MKINSVALRIDGSAGLGRRLGAVIIDGVLLMFALTASTQLGITGLIAIAGVFSLIEGFTPYSPGKAILGLRIRNADGTEATRVKLLSRWALKNIGYILGSLTFVTKMDSISLLGPLGVLIILSGGLSTLGSSRQALHDKVLDTAIFRSTLQKG